MRRLIGVMFIGALAVALSPARASSGLPPAKPYDLRSGILQRLFGETGDTRAAVAAAYGDRASESPLRELAFRFELKAAPEAVTIDVANVSTFAQMSDSAATVDRYFDLAQSLRARPLESNLRFSAPAVAPPVSAPKANSPGSEPSYTIAAYQPLTQTSALAPEPGAVSFVPLSRTEDGAEAMHVGPIQLQSAAVSTNLQQPQLSLHDNAYDAGANFAVRAGARKLNVGVSSSYEQFSRNDLNLTPTTVGSSFALPGDDPLVVPGYANVSRLSLGAGVAVPLVNGVTLNLNYDTARLLGGYGLPGLTNLDAIDNAYGGRLTFAIPHSASTLSFSAYQYRYQDNVLPANTLTQTRENVNLTVKF